MQVYNIRLNTCLQIKMFISSLGQKVICHTSPSEFDQLTNQNGVFNRALLQQVIKPDLSQ